MIFHRLFKGKSTSHAGLLEFLVKSDLGVDPSNNKSIIEYLNSLARENLGKIITLHIFGRIEEAPKNT